MSITLPRLTTSYASVDAINAALAQIEAALNSHLSTDDATANQMDVPLDMNSERILNLPLAASDNEPVTLGQLRGLAVSNIFEPGPHTQDWDTITGKPLEFPPAFHTHLVTQVNGLDTVLATYSNRISTLENRPVVNVTPTDPNLVVSQDVNNLWIY